MRFLAYNLEHAVRRMEGTSTEKESAAHAHLDLRIFGNLRIVTSTMYEFSRPESLSHLFRQTANMILSFTASRFGIKGSRPKWGLFNRARARAPYIGQCGPSGRGPSQRDS